MHDWPLVLVIKTKPPAPPQGRSALAQPLSPFRLGAARIGVGGRLRVLGVAGAHPARMADGIEALLIHETAALGFRVEEVFVIGRKQTPSEDLLGALGVGKGSPIFGLDIHDARDRIIALPWVYDVSVERQLPDTVVVRLLERKPAALWQQNGAFTLIDTRGEAIAVSDLGRFRDLIVVVGESAPAQIEALLKILDQEPSLRAMARAAVLVGGRRWDVHLDNAIRVQLPERDPADAWQRLASLQHRYRLLDKGLRLVDLRFPDRLIVQKRLKNNLERMMRSIPLNPKQGLSRVNVGWQ